MGRVVKEKPECESDAKRKQIDEDFINLLNKTHPIHYERVFYEQWEKRRNELSKRK